VIGYVVRAGIAFDEFCNVIFLNGDPDQTVSYHAAIAQEDGKRWGCWLCWALARLVQPDHCALQLEPGAGPTSAALRTGLCFLAAGAAIWAIAHYVIHLI
jgi:hypothetical protein